MTNYQDLVIWDLGSQASKLEDAMLAQSCRNQPESGPEKVFDTPEFDRSVTAVNPPELIGHKERPGLDPSVWDPQDPTPRAAPFLGGRLPGAALGFLAPTQKRMLCSLDGIFRIPDLGSRDQ